jgi:hypothetical protein
MLEFFLGFKLESLELLFIRSSSFLFKLVISIFWLKYIVCIFLEFPLFFEKRITKLQKFSVKKNVKGHLIQLFNANFAPNYVF